MLNVRQKPSKAPLAAAIMTAIGLSAAGSAAHAVGLADGNYVGDYVIYINPTPTAATSYGGTMFKFGKDGAWNSSFTFGGPIPGPGSQGMTDNGGAVTGSDGVSRGSSVAGDGWAGRVGIHANGNAISMTSFSKDLIVNTAGGNFVQYYLGQTPTNLAGGTVSGSGTVDTNGTMTLTTTGRLGAIAAPNTLYDRKWNVDDFTVPGATAWVPFTTGSISNNQNTITGARLTSLGDVNGDGVTDYSAILVTGGQVGSAWASFFGAYYFEVWNVKIISAVIKAASLTTPVNMATTISVPPTGSTGITPFAVSCASSAPAHGAVTCTSNSVTYTPTSGYTGADAFTYTATDGNGDPKTGTVNVTVQVAGAPIANPDSASTKQEATVSINAGSNDTINNSPAVYSVSGAASNGTATVTNAGTGIFSYTPNAGFVGNDSFTYLITDSASLTSSATVTVTVSEWGLTTNGTYAPGTLALSSGSTDGRISVASVPTDNTVVNQCVGGCFDFKVTTVTNPSVDVVLPPLSTAITAQNITDGLRYRKYNGGWKAFDTSNGSDAVASAPLTTGGGCPAPGDASWKTWAGAIADNSDVGDKCIRLSIADNGPNDSDAGLGTIADPSGAGSGTPTAVVIPPSDISSYSSSTQSGCSISPVPTKLSERGEWWLVAGFLVWLGTLMWRRGRGSKQA